MLKKTVMKPETEADQEKSSATKSRENIVVLTNLDRPKFSDCFNWTRVFTNCLEHCFHRFGLAVSKNPWLTILLSVILCIISTSGNIFWNENTNDAELWTPYGSPFIPEKQWVLEKFPKDTRYQSVALSTKDPNGNVLTADSIRYLYKLHNIVQSIIGPGNYSYHDLCFKSPSKKSKLKESKCATKSLLNLWEYNETMIENLTDESVQMAVTKALSKDLGPLEEIETILSGLEYRNSSDGKPFYYKARGLMNIWALKNNATRQQGRNDVDEIAMDWEEVFIDQLIHNEIEGIPDGIDFNAVAEKSFLDGIDKTINKNVQVMFGGFSLIFAYIMVTLGRWNVVEQRVLLALTGIIVVLFSLGASFGFCFHVGLFFADLHPAIPFLILGIGVDDMFVIVQAIDNLAKTDPNLCTEERVANAMKHAGISITVTSLSGIAAFLIGSTTRMPILRSFCLFAAMGVLFLYIFAITFFLACLTLDERRKDARKILNCDCIKAKPLDWKPNSLSQKNFCEYFFSDILSPILFKPYNKALIVVLTLSMVGLACFGVYRIKMDYKSVQYVDATSYQAKYYKIIQDLFPKYQYGKLTTIEVYIGRIPYWEKADELLELEDTLRDNQYIRNESVQFWYSKFHDDCCGEDVLKYCEDPLDWKIISFWGDLSCKSELGFKRKLLLFLQKNPYHIVDMRFNISLNDLDKDKLFDLYYEGNWDLTATRASFKYKVIDNTVEETAAINSVKSMLTNITFDPVSDQPKEFNFTHPIAWSYMYLQWEANTVLSEELVRNLSLTFGTIAIVSYFSISNLQVCMLVFVCVVFTVINVCGFAQFIGLNIEIITSICLILSPGLALDYAAHIGVMYACLKDGSRKQKMRVTLGSMGPAVMNGGLSTFLAFVLLGFSNSYVFSTFFKMFSMVVCFGLFHSLVFLPVLLSLIGPGSYSYDVNSFSSTQNNQEVPEISTTSTVKTSEPTLEKYSPIYPNANLPDLVKS